METLAQLLNDFSQQGHLTERTCAVLLFILEDVHSREPLTLIDVVDPSQAQFAKEASGILADHVEEVKFMLLMSEAAEKIDREESIMILSFFKLISGAVASSKTITLQ